MSGLTWYYLILISAILKLGQGQHDVAATANDLGRHAVPAIDNLQFNERWILPERLAADDNRLSLTRGPNHHGVSFDLRALLREFSLRGFLFLHHLLFNGSFEFLRECDVFHHNILDD